MKDNTELRVKLLKEIYDYYVKTNGEAMRIQLDKQRGKLTLGYEYLQKRNFIKFDMTDENTGLAVICPDGIDFLMNQVKRSG
ncbi:hypothetical protein PP175_14945 [Aneurinibacillus sp. Ricciae_BoGa-3]|uniref:hypothetical protein n=1 Tax=Aneurinibacillus sp. Ricciae_BoGa-3 TaxID=3022697 RepID=UPI00233FABE0|nr:hypothetical protein [Aneurinibacillus sp. Ricciae_BoGa-3]WCK52725.1 hypothetical protein PP175_14945 [Aneurinibacillus sp. Ricciae_BoGa-3]